MALTKTPQQVYEGSPVDPNHRVVPADARRLSEEIREEYLAIGANVEALEALDIEDRLDAMEGTVTAGQISKAPVELVAPANVTLSGEQTIDGVLTSASRVAVTNQSSAQQNGIYVTASGAWTRATDMDTSAKVNLTTVLVEGGETHGAESWKFWVADPDTFTLGSDAIAAVKVDDPKSLKDYLDAEISGKVRQTVRRTSELGHAAAVASIAVAENSPTSFFAASEGYSDWSLGFDVGNDLAVGDAIDVVRALIDVTATTQVIRVKVWKRALSDTGTQGAGPGQAGDVLLQTRDLAVSDTKLVPGIARTVEFPLEYFEAEEDVCYLVEIDARTAGDERDALGMGWLTETGSQRRSGYFRSSGNPATWANLSTGSALGITLARSVPATASATASDIDALRDARTGLDGALEVGLFRQAATLGQGEFGFTSGIYAWAQAIVGGVDTPGGMPATGFRIPFKAAAGATRVRFRIWSRPVGAWWLSQAPGNTFDRLDADVTSTLAELGLVAGDTAMAEVVFRFPRLVFEDGWLHIWELEAQDDAGNRILSAIPHRTDGGFTTHQLRKWWRSGAAVAWSAGVTSTTYRYPFDLVIDGYETAQAPSISDKIAAASAEIIGNAIIVEGIAGRSGDQKRFSGRLSLVAPASGTVTDEELTLTPRGGAAILWSYLRNRTEHAQMSNVVVKRASDGVVLVKNTDYALIEELGCLSLQSTSGDNLDVLVSYDWTSQRYDLVSYVPATGEIAVTKGVDTDRDAQERIPTAPAGHVPLFNVRLGASTGNEAIPVWDVSPAGVRRAIAADASEEDARNRRLLRPVLRKLRAGDPVTLLSYGDSNFAQIGGGYSLAAVRSEANTIYHDRTLDSGGLLHDKPIGADILAGITLYDTGDGAGLVHTRFGIVWELIRALEDGYSSTISYENRSIPGTRSEALTYHGLDSVRLSAATGAGADFAIIGFGQNELGQSYTRANVIDICEAFLAEGTLPLVMGCFRPNLADLHALHTDANWRFTQRALREAALAADVPYVSTEVLYEDGEAMGLSGYDHCAATLDLHPGPYEVRRLGARLAAALSDSL
ncbi:hypothetical protein CEW88_15620 [Alloyangia pacifica]|uniref:SGNH hydrolase-type esterase domain-containing protein n=1 Tax=Alloyangia pacifica TaxID=311180 RepID=A0A2U8HJH5_9RHOB|nr:hypothetical protein [Alloyangia pacifica]AWI85176.1 hypothetical protein CEW88_15620 [Alloyangia pacifica]